VADEVERGQPERVGEGDRVGGHRLDGVGHGRAGRRDAGVIEQDDLAVAGEGVAQGRVVVIQGAHEVLEQHQRRTFRHPGTAVCEADPPRSAYWVGAVSCVNEVMTPASLRDGHQGYR
jgi:hypothetical protein